MNLSTPLRSAALLVLLSACASARSTMPTTTNPPVVTTAPAPTSAAPRGGAPAARESAPANWHRLDLEQDGVLGVGSERALRELLANRRPGRRVIVAVIDGGTDTAHTLLAPNVWRNPRETPGNGRDDDGNGYADDVFGWNYIGGANGENVHHDTFELTRLHASCRSLPAGRGIPKPDAARCAAIARSYGAKRQEILGTLGQIGSISAALTGSERVLKEALRTDSLTVTRVRAFTPTTPAQEQAKGLWLQLADNGLDAKEIADARKAYEGQARYGLDTTFNPRRIVGTDSGPPMRPYGNRDVTGPDASHGTHVAGIIGARRDRGGDVQGIAPDVTIMAIRAVPDGDERDEDVASAIRYAVDNGANIINMSFGKSYSPRKSAVDSAVRYAESRGVLLVHAAGNDGENIDVEPSFPSPTLETGERSRSWLEVGASSWKGGSRLAATFSNYGKSRVDLFAPGEDILSTVPGGQTKKESGTSMAAPVVSGVAALLMSYFPNLSASDVRELLVTTARPLGHVDITGPGESGQLKFGALSRTGGVVDAYAAVKAALSRVPTP